MTILKTFINGRRFTIHVESDLVVDLGEDSLTVMRPMTHAPGKILPFPRLQALKPTTPDSEDLAS